MRLSRTTYVGIAVIALIVIIAAAFFVIKAHAASSESVASHILSVCDTGNGDNAHCYESEVPKLYPKLSVSEIFDVIRRIRVGDPSYQFCHVLAHKVGERVVAQDPDGWFNAIPFNPPDGYCSNGFIHGVIGGRFRADVLSETTVVEYLSDFRRACEPRPDWSPSDLDKAICYHGLGHLYDFITNADLKRALALCEQTAPDQFRRVCIEGVFMQIFQPLEPDDFELISQMSVQPTLPTVRKFCASFIDPEYVGACLRESWPLYPGMTDGTGATAYCAAQPTVEHEDKCYQTAFTIIGRLLLATPDKAAHACSVVPAKRREMCYAIVANAILEEDRNNAVGAVAFCARADRSERCIDFLMQTAPFNFGDNKKAYATFCAALPESIQARCGALPATAFTLP